MGDERKDTCVSGNRLGSCINVARTTAGEERATQQGSRTEVALKRTQPRQETSGRTQKTVVEVAYELLR